MPRKGKPPKQISQKKKQTCGVVSPPPKRSRGISRLSPFQRLVLRVVTLTVLSHLPLQVSTCRPKVAFREMKTSGMHALLLLVACVYELVWHL